MNEYKIYKHAPALMKANGIIAGTIILIISIYALHLHLHHDITEFQFFPLIGIILGALYLLYFIAWTSRKIVFEIDPTHIMSKFPKGKFNLDWTNVSKVNETANGIVFYADGGKHEKEVLFSNLKYPDAVRIRQIVQELCNEKHINFVIEFRTEEKL